MKVDNTDSSSPAMSVILVTPDLYATIRRTIGRLRAQTVCEQLELVIVASSLDGLGLDPTELAGFHSYQTVEVGPIESIASAYAAGVRKATAPIVALAEDHSYPARNWAEALIARHREPWAAVGPVISNANPGTTVSWADLFIGYGPWLYPSEAGTRTHLPGHNSSYKRDLLLAYGEKLEAMMEAESVMQWDLRSRGHGLYLEPKARTFHTNFGLLGSWVRVQSHSARVFAGARARGWPIWKRLVFVCGSPLIPLVRLRRILADLPKSGPAHRARLRTLPMLILGLTLDGMWQMIGYALGAGDSQRKLSQYEFYRDRHIPQRERNVEPEQVEALA